MKQKTQTLAKLSYNDTVQQAFNTTLKQAKQLLATIKSDDLRCYFERKSVNRDVPGIVHEVISPLLYLRLTAELDGLCDIRFGIEPIALNDDLSCITAQFLRNLFANTAKEATDTNIEGCIQTDWFINCCSEMYEFLEMDNKHHALRKVPYKMSSSQRKRVLTLA